MALLTVENLRMSYEGATVVDGLSFCLESGQYLCVVGENGSGKSTLVKAVAGLKHPADGRIVFGDGLRRSDVGYLAQQNPLNREFPASVREIVLSGCLGVKDRRATAAKYLEMMGMSAYTAHPFSELSGGQQQRVLLARALCAAGRLLLLDEPAAGLDPVATEDFYSVISRMNKEGLTVMAVSHDIPAAVKYASHILHLGNHPLFFGTSSDYITSDAGKRFFGGEQNA